MKRPAPVKLALITCFLSLWTTHLWAHQPSDSYLRLNEMSGNLSGRWDIHLLDLELALGLDDNGDGDLTWGEVRRRHGDIADYALAHLNLSRGGQPCHSTVTDQAIDYHGGAPYSVLSFDVDCGSARGPIEGLYSLFFDLDPSHRGMLRLSSAKRQHSVVLAPRSARFSFDASAATAYGDTARAYLHEGVVHIWGGFDHILFLLTLLLPAVLLRVDDRWLGAPSFRQAVTEVLKIVTAFTVAHSLTLAVAVLGFVSLPSRLVESVIALTVVLAAIHNLRPVVQSKVWVLALILGLIHGFGFAGVLADLDLTGSALAVALASFNIGVELGQLAIVAVFLPLAFALRRTWVYQRVVYLGGSSMVAVIAFYWLWQRSLGIG